jgi:predicted nucleic acid-binding protein
MRLILDTNILVAALITRGTPPDKLYEAWRDGRFTLLTSELQIEEIRRVTRREGIRFRIHQAEAGRLVNDLRRLATLIDICRRSMFRLTLTTIFSWRWPRPARPTFS